MKTRWPGIVVVAICVSIGTSAALSAPASSVPERIVIVSMPSVTWEDVDRGLAPNILKLAQRGALASMSVRTVGARTDLASAYATIGAGNRARASGNFDNPIRAQTFASGSQLSVFGMQRVIEDNDELRFGAEPGLLGDILHANGYRTAVVGNADGGAVGYDAKERKPQGLEKRRFAGLALADRDGRLDGGDVSDDLVLPDTRTINGFRTDPEVLLKSFDRAAAGSDVVLVELADAFREGQVAFASVVGGSIRPPREESLPLRDAAIRRDDALLGQIVARLDLESDALLLVGAGGLGPAKHERLTTAVLVAPGIDATSWLTSATSRREGIVTISDIGPGILRLLEIQPPPQMTGQAIHGIGSHSGGIEPLLAMNSAASFHLNWIDEFFGTFVLLQILLYVLAWRYMARLRGGTILRLASLGLLSIPLATLLHRLIHGDVLQLALIPLVAVLIALASLKGPWSKSANGPALFICCLSLGALVLDIVAGAPLQLSSLIGYSPIVAGRFYGMGNIAFALLATMSMLVLARFSHGSRFKGTILLVLGAILVLVVGLPSMGADLGGMLALIPSLGFLWLVVAGKRLSWWRAVLLLMSGAAIALAAGYLDSLRPVDDQTHLGRFVTRLFSSGLDSVQEIIVRKMLANWSLLTNSVLTLSIPAGMVLLTLGLLRPGGPLRTAMQMVPGLRNGLLAAAVVNGLGFALNDSGIAIPAMGFAIAIPFCLSIISAKQVENQHLMTSSSSAEP